MATKAYRIYSHYSTDDRKRLEHETGQTRSQSPSGLNYELKVDASEDPEPRRFDGSEEDADLDEAWRHEKSTFGLSQRILRPPRFVPATLTGVGLESTYTAEELETIGDSHAEMEKDIGSWYKSLARQTDIPAMSSDVGSSTKAVDKYDSSSSQTEPVVEARHRARLKARIADPTWFITRSLPTTPLQSSTESVTQTLSRTLPPTPSSQNNENEKVPVFLTIGPWNKGYQMLNKNWGWEEGDVLGIRRGNKRVIGAPTKAKDVEDSLEARAGTGLTLDDVIDLTQSDSEAEDAIFLQPKFPQQDSDLLTRADLIDEDLERLQDESTGDNDTTTLALQTPLRATLKADKLGIGFRLQRRHHHLLHHHLKQQQSSHISKKKRKSLVQTASVSDSRSQALKYGETLFRASFKGLPPVKRPDPVAFPSGPNSVTNPKKSASGQKAGQKLPRGRRGFERAKKNEELARKRLLAYLNTD